MTEESRLHKTRSISVSGKLIGTLGSVVGNSLNPLILAISSIRSTSRSRSTLKPGGVTESIPWSKILTLISIPVKKSLIWSAVNSIPRRSFTRCTRSMISCLGFTPSHKSTPPFTTLAPMISIISRATLSNALAAPSGSTPRSKR